MDTLPDLGIQMLLQAIVSFILHGSKRSEGFLILSRLWIGSL